MPYPLKARWSLRTSIKRFLKGNSEKSSHLSSREPRMVCVHSQRGHPCCVQAALPSHASLTRTRRARACARARARACARERELRRTRHRQPMMRRRRPEPSPPVSVMSAARAPLLVEPLAVRSGRRRAIQPCHGEAPPDGGARRISSSCDCSCAARASDAAALRSASTARCSAARTSASASRRTSSAPRRVARSSHCWRTRASSSPASRAATLSASAIFKSLVLSLCARSRLAAADCLSSATSAMDSLHEITLVAGSTPLQRRCCADFCTNGGAIRSCRPATAVSRISIARL